MKTFFVVLSLLAVGVYGDAKVDAAGSKAAEATVNADKNKVLNDRTVESLLLKEKGININTFIVDFLMNRNTKLEAPEAYKIVSKITDEQKNSPEFLAVVTRVLDLAAEMKEKIVGCKFTQNKTVDGFIEKDSAEKVRDQLIELSDFWTCAEEVDAAEAKAEEVPVQAKYLDYMQWKHLQDLRDSLSINPRGVASMCVEYLQGAGYITEDMIPMATLVSETLVGNEEVIKNSLSFIDSLEVGLKSEAGRRVLNLIPRLMDAQAEDAVNMIAAEADFNQNTFFNLIGNVDVSNVFFKQVSRFLIGAYELGKMALNDNMKLAIANGMLISNNFPPLQKRNLLESIVKIFEKVWAFFSTYRIENLDILGKIKAFNEQFEKHYFKYERMETLTEAELETVMSQFLQAHVLPPVKNGWMANRHVSAQSSDCAEALLCLYNEAFVEKKENDNEITPMVSRAGSYALAYSWSNVYDLDMGKMSEAIETGLKGEVKCGEKFGDKAKTCDIYARERQKLSMDLSYDHTEL